MDPEISDSGIDSMKANMLEAADKQKEQEKVQAPHKSIFQTMAEKFGFGKKDEPPVPTPDAAVAAPPTPPSGEQTPSVLLEPEKPALPTQTPNQTLPA